MTFVYPEARQDDSIVENIHGIEVLDPYRWMEHLDFEETKKFIEDQNAITKVYLKGLKYKDVMRKNLIDMWNFPNFEVPMREGEKYFQFRNSGNQNLDILYIGNTLERLVTNRTVFFDPNELDNNGNLRIESIKFSKNGKTMAYTIKHTGSEWLEVRFREVETMIDRTDILKNVKHGEVEWLYDEGILYSIHDNQSVETRETGILKNQHLYYHQLGSKQSKDVIIFSFGCLIGNLYSCISYCENYLIVSHSVAKGGNTVDVAELQGNCPFDGELPFKSIISDHNSTFSFITNNNNMFLFRVNKKAMNYFIIVIDINNPSEEFWKILIPEHYINILEKCQAINNNQLVLLYRQDAKHILKLYDIISGNEVCDIPIEIGAVMSMSGKREHTELFIKFQSMIIPALIYKIDFTSLHLQTDIFQEVRFRNSTKYEILKLRYYSTDYVEIPMYLLHRKGLVKNGGNPCLLTCYGELNSMAYPIFSVLGMFFVNSFNGIYAIANIRCDGRYGEKWYTAGSFENKQNSFEDFQNAAKYLFDTKYTNPSKLVIYGASNSGLLVGACVNQAPELYGAAITRDADMDMLRYNMLSYSKSCLFEHGCSDNVEYFKFLYKYSPFHNIRIPKKKIQYPAMLLLVGDLRKRAPSTHSLKYIAKLQNIIGKLTHQKKPLLIHIDTNSDSKNSTIKNVEELVDVFSFITKSLDIYFDKHPNKNKPILQ